MVFVVIALNSFNIVQLLALLDHTSSIDVQYKALRLLLRDVPLKEMLGSLLDLNARKFLANRRCLRPKFSNFDLKPISTSFSAGTDVCVGGLHSGSFRCDFLDSGARSELNILCPREAGFVVAAYQFGSAYLSRLNSCV